jgi:hypothetical protein
MKAHRTPMKVVLLMIKKNGKLFRISWQSKPPNTPKKEL